MANANVPVTGGSGYNIDTRTTTTDGDNRQVIVVGDPAIDNNVAAVATVDPGPTSSAAGVVVRLAGSANVQIAGFTGSAFLTGVYNSVAVYFDRANPSVNGGTPTVASITNTVGVYFDRANPSVNVGTPTVASITNTVGVYFDRANPSVNVGTPTVTSITNTVVSTLIELIHR